MNGFQSQEPLCKNPRWLYGRQKWKNMSKNKQIKKENWDFFSDKSVYISGPVQKYIYIVWYR